MKRIGIVMSLLAVFAGAVSAEYYVSAAGDDANDGLTEARRLKPLPDALGQSKLEESGGSP